MNTTNSILVIASHPDDELLGCGGTMAKHSENGDEVNILIIAEGGTSRQQTRDRNSIKTYLNKLHKTAVNSGKILGINKVELLDFPDNRLDSIDLLDLIKVIEDKINLLNPNIIYTHHHGDLNIDHQKVNQAVITACRPIPGQVVKKILSFEVASSTEWNPIGSGFSFSPNYFVDISNQLDKKIEALKLYEEEMREWPHARSIKAVEIQSLNRGAQIGVSAAEAFILLREIN